MNIRKKINTINFKTLSYLIFFSIAILLLLWIFQILFLSVFYEKEQIEHIEHIANNIPEEKQDGSLIHYLEETAFKNNICIEYVAGENVRINFNDQINSCVLRNDNTQVMKYKEELINSDEEKNIIKLVDPENNARTLLYSIKVNNGYVIINAPLEDINTTSALLTGQLIYITLITIVLASLIAYFLSKQITKPIVEITKETKKISKREQARYKKTGIHEIDELIDTLNLAQKEMEKTDDYRRDLMANVSHDLKTPLTMIKAYAEMIKDISYKDKSQREKHLNIIMQETERLNLLVNDILDLSKMQSDELSLNEENYDLAVEINNIIKRYEIIKVLENYKIDIEIPKEVNVVADKSKINQVIYNLLNNAINYTGENKKIKIKISLDKNYYLVEIIDSGKGIKPEDLNNIWNKYYKNEKNHQRNVVGTGIGLSIVKEILDKHNLEYGVNSVLKKGTTFYFKIKKSK